MFNYWLPCLDPSLYIKNGNSTKIRELGGKEKFGGILRPWDCQNISDNQISFQNGAHITDTNLILIDRY